MESDTPIVLVNKTDRAYNVHGSCMLKAVLTVHDGKSNFFESMPPSVRKRFTSTSGIRQFMGGGHSCKVFAILCEDFQGKGPYKYELSNTRVRQGFGKSNIKFIPPEGVRRDAAELFFGKAYIGVYLLDEYNVELYSMIYQYWFWLPVSIPKRRC